MGQIGLETNFLLLTVFIFQQSGDIVTASLGENSVVPDPDIFDNVYDLSYERMRSVHAC